MAQNKWKPDRQPHVDFGSAQQRLFFGDLIIDCSFYQYYQDNWGSKAHAIGLETAIKITLFIFVSLVCQFYTQSAVDFLLCIPATFPVFEIKIKIRLFYSRV
jgi:hypothetical protein